MRVLIAVMISIMLCFQPMISLSENSNDNYEIVPFSSLQESSVPDNWWEDTNMDKDNGPLPFSSLNAPKPSILCIIFQ